MRFQTGPRKRQLTIEERKNVLVAYNRLLSIRKTSELLKVPKSTVGDIIKLSKVRGTASQLPRCGRPRKTSNKEDKMIKRISQSNPRLTAVDIKSEISSLYGINVHVSTVKRRLKDVSLYGRRPAKKPFVSAKNRKARIEFAKNHIEWKTEQWENVLWSDESKFCLFGSDGISYVRRPANKRFEPKYQIPTIKHGGGNVMVWGCFSRNGVGPIVQIEEKMNAIVYRDILRDAMVTFAERNMAQSFLFQHDNDPKHKSKFVSEWFRQERIEVLPWPSQSPDLNPIEHLWDHLDRQIKGRNAKNAKEKFKIIKEEWQKIPVDVCRNLVDSMQKRCFEVIKTLGFPTKY